MLKLGVQAAVEAVVLVHQVEAAAEAQEDQAIILQEALQDQVPVHLLQAHQDLQEALRVQVLQVERVLLVAQATIQHHLRVLDQLQHLLHLVLQLFREAQVMTQHQVVTQLLLLQEDLTTILVERQICAIPFL